MTKRNRQARLVLPPKAVSKLEELNAVLGPGYQIDIVKKKKRGRPKKRLYVMRNEGLVLSLDWMMEEYRQKGLTEREARKNAFAEMREAMKTEDQDGHPLPEGKRRRLTAETFERYYRAGIRKLRDGEMQLATVIDKIAAKRGQFVRDVVGEDKDPINADAPPGVTWRRYRRGKRALSIMKTGKIFA